MHKSNSYPGEPGFEPGKPVPVGGVLTAADPIVYNDGRPVKRIAVRNTGDRPVQVGSHFHFFEVNRYLEFDREAAFGCHLNIPATTAVRFEPGDEKRVELVPFAGKRRLIGFNGLTMGYAGDEDQPVYLPTRDASLRRMERRGFRNAKEQPADGEATHPKGPQTKSDTHKKVKSDGNDQ